MVRWSDPSKGKADSFLICITAELLSTTWTCVSDWYCLFADNMCKWPTWSSLAYNQVSILLRLVEASDVEVIRPLDEVVSQRHPVLGVALQDTDEVAVSSEPHRQPFEGINGRFSPVGKARATVGDAQEYTSLDLVQDILVLRRAIPRLDERLWGHQLLELALIPVSGLPLLQPARQGYGRRG